MKNINFSRSKKEKRAIETKWIIQSCQFELMLQVGQLVNSGADNSIIEGNTNRLIFDSYSFRIDAVN